jgi:predicted PurR-regulated permease PerM
MPDQNNTPRDPSNSKDSGGRPGSARRPRRRRSRRSDDKPGTPTQHPAGQRPGRRSVSLGKGLSLQSVAIPFLTIIAAAAFCYFARPILVPLATAMTLAYVLSPAVDLLERKIPRTVAVIVVLGFAIGVLGLLGFVLIDQGTKLANAAPGYWQNLKTMVGDPQVWIAKLPVQLQDMLPEIDIWSQFEFIDFSAISATLFSGLGSVLSFLGWGVLVAFLTLFLILEMPHMRNQLIHAMGRDSEAAMSATMADIDRQLRTFLAVKVGTSAALGVVATLGLLLMDVPFAYVWGPLVGLLNIIPYIGSIISAVPPIVMVMIQTQSFLPGLWVALFILLLQQLEGNVVTPKIMGSKVQLNVVAVILSTIVWGWLWGAVGILLAIPIAATTKVVCERIEPLRPIAVMMG